MKLLVCTQTIDKNDPILGFFHRWILAFAEHCESVHVLALNVGEYDLPDNVHVHCLGKSEGRGKLVQLWRLWKYSVWLRSSYDGVFVHMNPEYVLYGGMVWRVLGKRIGLWYTHGTVSFKLRAATYFAHHIFTASPESFRIDTKKKIVTGHGLDLGQFSCTDPNEAILHLITISRISRTKNITILLRAFEIFARESKDATLTIVGGPVTDDDRQYEREVRLLAEVLALADQVRFVGDEPHEKVASYLAQADVFVNVSGTGSLDKAALEAMTSCLPVITSNEGVRSVLGADAEALFVPALGPENISQALFKLAALPKDERSALGKRLRSTVEQDHGLERLIPRILNQYQGPDK